MRFRRRHLIGLAAVLVTAVLAVFDLLDPLFRQFWIEHAMLTSLLASALFVVVGLTTVEQYIGLREEKRLRLVVGVAYASLARVTQGQMRILWFMTNGGPLIDDLDFVVKELGQVRLHEILARMRFGEVSENDVRFELQPAPDLESRLRELSGDDEWVIVCYDALRDLLQSSRIVMARWAALLVGTDSSSDVLLQLASQADALSRLMYSLFPIVRLRQAGRPSFNDREFSRAWTRCFTNAVIMTEGLNAMGGGMMARWGRTELRNLLPQEQRSFVQGMERNNSLGVLRPYR